MPVSIKTLENKAKKAFLEASNLQELEGILKQYLGSKGELTVVLRSLAKLSKQKRIKLGKAANSAKTALLEVFEQQKKKFQGTGNQSKDWFDVSVPGMKVEKGHLHPVTLARRRAEDIFRSMGFAVASGPEIETEWYNFDALNIAKDHPARDMWDTFWLRQNEIKNQKSKIKNGRLLLRTHTSPVQIRFMETHEPPLRIVVPGRCFRYEATDASHETNFHQLEGLMVGKDITASNFKAVIQEFLSRFFAKPVAIRLRPTYFPFTEPSFEVDASCVACEGKGCSVCGGDGWLELMGAGMVHPNVFKNVGYNPKEWQGFAFGVGLDRLAMLKYKVNDIRLFFNGDLRFLQQF